jgi:hypothetical protein
MLKNQSIPGPIAALISSNDRRLATFSTSIAKLSWYATLTLVGRPNESKGRLQFALLGSSLAIGAAICAIRYIGTEACHLSVTVRYDPPAVFVSLLIAFVSSGIALSITCQPSSSLLQAAGRRVLVSCGIAGLQHISILIGVQTRNRCGQRNHDTWDRTRQIRRYKGGTRSNQSLQIRTSNALFKYSIWKIIATTRNS